MTMLSKTTPLFVIEVFALSIATNSITSTKRRESSKPLSFKKLIVHFSLLFTKKPYFLRFIYKDYAVTVTLLRLLVVSLRLRQKDLLICMV